MLTRFAIAHCCANLTVVRLAGKSVCLTAHACLSNGPDNPVVIVVGQVAGEVQVDNTRRPCSNRCVIPRTFWDLCETSSNLVSH